MQGRHLQDQHSDMSMPSSSDDDEAYGHRRPGCRERNQTVSNQDLNSVPWDVRMLSTTQVNRDGTHGGFGPRRSLRTMEARGRVPLRTDLLGAMDVHEVGAGFIADILPVGHHQGRRRCSAQRPQQEVLLDIASQSVSGDDAHGIGHRRSLLANYGGSGPYAFAYKSPFGPPDILEVGAQLRSRPPKQPVDGVDADATAGQGSESASSNRAPVCWY